jgi:signal transduction histidine kinase
MLGFGGDVMLKPGMRLVATMLLCLLSGGEAHAGASVLPTDQDLVIDRSYYVDPNANTTWSDLPLDGFVPFGPVLNGGFSRNPYWIRLSLPAGDPSKPNWVVRVLPVWHDQVYLYDPVVSDVVARAGDALATTARTDRSLSLSFDIPQTTQARPIFLKVDSPHSIIVDAVVVEAWVARRLDQNGFAFLSAYLGFLCAILILSFLTWLSDRERVIGVFCLQLLAAILYAVAMYGLLRVWLVDSIGPNVVNQITNALIVIYPNLVVLFYRIFYSDFGLRLWVARTLDALVIISVLNLGLIVQGSVGLALNLNATLLLVATFFILLSPWVFLRPVGDVLLTTPRWAIRVSGIVLGFPALLGVVRTVEWLPESRAPVSIYLFHAMILALVMSMIMQYRARRRAMVIEEARVEALKAAREERSLRETLAQFMNMLGHEIRTPLSVLRLSVDDGLESGQGKARAQAAIEDIDLLVSRALAADAIASGELKPSVDVVSLKAVIDATIERLGMEERIVWTSSHEEVVDGDEWFIQVMASNLLENALKYAVPDSLIELKLGWRSDGEGRTYWLFRVRNSIDAHQVLDVERIFDRFYREAWAKRLSGAGLGLYLTRSLARMLGGDVVASRPWDNVVEMELMVPQ